MMLEIVDGTDGDGFIWELKGGDMTAAFGEGGGI